MFVGGLGGKKNKTSGNRQARELGKPGRGWWREKLGDFWVSGGMRAPRGGVGKGL